MVVKESTITRLEAVVNKIAGQVEVIFPRLEKIDELVESITRLEEQGKYRSEALEELTKKVDSLCTSESVSLKKNGKENFVEIFLKREPIIFLVGAFTMFQIILASFGLDKLLNMAAEYIKKQLGL